MPHTVDVSDFGTIEFPDEMSEDEIKSALQKKFAPSAPTMPEFQTPTPPTAETRSIYEEPTSLDVAASKIGGPLHAAGKTARDIAAAYMFEGIGQPELQAAQLGVSPEAVKKAGMVPEPEAEKTPIELGMEQLPTALQIPSKATYGLIEATPQLGAVMGAEALGIPAPVAAAAVFGSTPEGFDPKSAAIAAALPFIGKFSGEIAGTLAKKAGVETTQAINAVKGLAGIGGPAATLAAEQELEIQKLPKDQQHQARIDMWANIAGQSMLGPMGVKFEKAGPAEVAGRMLGEQLKKGVPDAEIKEPTPSGIPAVEREPAVVKPEGEAEVGTAQREGAGKEGQAAGEVLLKQEEAAPAAPEKIAEDVGARFDGETDTPRGKMWRFTMFDESGKESSSFHTKAGATPEEIRGKYEEARGRYGEEEATRPRAPKAVEPAAPTDPAAVGKELGWTFNPEAQAGGLKLEGLTPEQRAMVKPTWEFTDRRPDSPTKGLTFYVKEGATPAEIAKAHEAKVTEYIEGLPKYEEVGIGRETAQESSRAGNNPQTGLPPSVAPGPQNFPAELLEASRRLGTLVKSRTTLPEGTLGQYRRARIGQDDAIEVGDIRNQLTVSHEMGHDIDALIFPQQNLARTQKSLGDRVGESGKEMQNELVPISELMRGKIEGSKGHKAYRRSAVELIADFFALYSHDPARARTMAPKFSAGFEKALAGFPDAAETIRQLHAGNVEPVAPTTLLPPTGPAAGMPGAVPGRPEPAKIPRDPVLAVAAEDLVKGLARTYKAEVETAGVKADTWREDLPNQQDRNDIGAFMEGSGNLEIPGDTITAVKERMTPAKKKLLKTIRFEFELQRQRINEFLKGSTEGEYLKFLEDYLPHFYVNSKTPAGMQALARFRKDSPNAKQRKIPTLQEAVEYGLVPITQDPAVLYENTSTINWRVATNRKLLSEAKNMQSGGQPIIMPPSEAPPGWPRSNNPLIQRAYARQTPGGTLLWKGGAAIHPDAWRAFQMMLEEPTSGKAGRYYDAINSLTRANAFAFSLFHDVTLRSASLGAQMQWYNPVRGLFRLFERNPLTGELEIFRGTRSIGKELLKDAESVRDAALHGLQFSWHASESYQHAARNSLDKVAAQLRDVPYLGKTARIARDIQRWRQEGLWKNTHDALKIASYNDIVAKALQELPKDAPEAQVKAIKENTASFLNDSFGGQEWETKFWLHPELRKKVARFFLAPDWTLSTIRSIPFLSDAFSVTKGRRGEGLSFDVTKQTETGQSRFTYNNPTYGGISRAKFWGAEIMALATATVAAQYAIYQAFGDKKKGDKEWTWENELGQNRRIDVTPLMRQFPWRKKDDPTRYYVNLGKRPEEILGWVIHPETELLGKMARPVAEVFRQITGTEGDFKAQWKRDHESFIESLPARAKSVAGTLVPFTFSGNQFALSLPYRKGMSKYKAQEAYESAYELMAEPNRFRSITRSQTTNIDKLVAEISDAAERNGVPSETVRRRALSTTRGKFYDKYFKAMNKDDKNGMEDAANALSRLGATPEGLQESMKRKMAVEPRLPE